MNRRHPIGIDPRPRDAGAAGRLAAALLIAAASGCGEDPPNDAPSAPATSSAGDAADGGFVDTAQQAGIAFKMAFLPAEQGARFKVNLYDHGSGVAVGDCDGDGDDDLYFLNQLGPNALYRNDGRGAFTDVTAAAGAVALADRICVAAAFNDVDGDGDQDLFVTSTRGGNALLRNDGTGRFEDVTREAGLEWVGHSEIPTLFDADGDGDLDLFMTQTARWTTDLYSPEERYYAGVASLTEVIQSPVEHNRYYRNEGGGRFTEQTAAAGLQGDGWGSDVAVFDSDDDGDLDLFVGNMFGASTLYANDGRGRFEPVTRAALGRTPWGATGAKVLDHDGDGRLDLYVVDMHSDMWTPASYDLSTVEEGRKYAGAHGALMDDPSFDPASERNLAEATKLDYDEVFFGNGLYRNLGGGRFEEVSERANAETFWPWGIAAGDFDGDGFEDAFIPSGMGYPWDYWRSPLLMNDGDGTFTDRSGSAGIDPPPGGELLPHSFMRKDCPRSARAAATGDFDGDGRLDLVVNNFNDRPNLFMNRWPRRSFIAFRLTGTRGNRDAIGAIVRLEVAGRVLVRQVQAAGGYLAQSSKTVHFGLGDARSIDRCEILWPGGFRQAIGSPAPGRVHAVTEPAP